MPLRIRQSLTSKLLLLTLLFVLVAEILIFVPAVAKYRLDWIEDKLKASHLAALALAEAPKMKVSDQLESDLLSHVRARAIDLSGPAPDFHVELNMTSSFDKEIARTWNIDTETYLHSLIEGLTPLISHEHYLLKIEGTSPFDPKASLKVVISEEELCHQLVLYGQKIALSSLGITLLAGAFLFILLRFLFVRPIYHMTSAIDRFKKAPDLPSSILTPSHRQDELGRAEQELSDMQTHVQKALQQKARLAALGTAVTKIQHDLRNILTTSSLLTEGLTLSEDPKARATADRLFLNLGRAEKLCTETLSYAREGGMTLFCQEIDLHLLLQKVKERFLASPSVTRHTQHDITWALHTNTTPVLLSADAEQLERVFENLARNSLEAGATKLIWNLDVSDTFLHLTLTDNGEGFSPRAKKHLFEPFLGSVKPSGTGLGLPLSREIIHAHHGEITLISSSAEATIFQIRLPLLSAPLL